MSTTIGTPQGFEQALRHTHQARAEINSRRDALAVRIEQASTEERAAFIALCVSRGSTPDDADYQAPLRDHIQRATVPADGETLTEDEYLRAASTLMAELEAWHA
jgi:hypothetical protein